LPDGKEDTINVTLDVAASISIHDCRGPVHLSARVPTKSPPLAKRQPGS
jgi:hypothetical protein